MEMLFLVVIAYLVYLFFFKKKNSHRSYRSEDISEIKRPSLEDKNKSQRSRPDLVVSINSNSRSNYPETSNKPKRSRPNVIVSVISNSETYHRQEPRELQIGLAGEPSESINHPFQDDDLATFTILSGNEEEISSNKTAARWVEPGDEITLAGVKIAAGNFYFGGLLEAYFQGDNYYTRSSTEASLVDNSLKIKKESYSFIDESLGYWPKFISISPRCRGAYINWLSSNRDDPETPLGYIFIYFYGLERRIAVDALKGDVSNDEYLNIFSEVNRLRSIYGTNQSFKNYSYRLLEFMCIHQPNVVSMERFKIQASSDSLLFRVNLARAVALGSPVSATLALDWLKNTQNYSLRTPARRCTLEFSELFKARYIEKYKEGILVKPNKTKLQIGYFSASSTLNGIRLDKETLPDPSILKGPVKKLAIIADQCTDSL